jgi:ornithine cyclodeaminase/alanine dehydrogenase-like protein (mu-crystallin family)
MYVLSEDAMSKLLHSLSREDILILQHALAQALHTYSSTAENEAIHQPLRTSIRRRDGSATLFMPAADQHISGVKVVTLAAPSEKTEDGSEVQSKDESVRVRMTEPDAAVQAEAESTSPRGTLTLLTPSGRPFAFMSAASLTAFRTALASCMLISKRTNVKTLTVFGAGAQAYWHIRLALFVQPSIQKVNIINRSFARGAKLMKDMLKAENAPWKLTTKFNLLSQNHGEYTRLLKEQVRKADVIFCCTPSTEPLFPASYLTNPEGRKKARLLCLIGSYMPHMCEVPPEIIRAAIAPKGHHHGHAEDGSDGHHHKHFNFSLFGSSASSSTKSSSTNSQQDSSSSIGSGETGTTTPTSSISSLSLASSGIADFPPLPHMSGAIIVDSLSHCLEEAGELISARITANQCVEFGELCMLKKAAKEDYLSAQASIEARGTDQELEEKLGSSPRVSMRSLNTTPGSRSNSRDRRDSGSRDRRKSARAEEEKERSEQRKRDGGLLDWLERGNVVYKSVGMGLMDITIGRELVELAQKTGRYGVSVEGF